MSYETGTATDPEDLMSKLNTFLTGTPGWTSELFSAVSNRAIWSKAGVSAKIFVQWDANNIGLSMIQDVASPIDQSLTNQVGSEHTADTITSNRYVNIVPGPYPSYHFFEDDDYIHVVVEKSSGIYRHFGWGQMLKLGKWTGGMYAYGHYWDQSTSNIDNPNQVAHLAAFNGVNANNSTRGAGVHAEGLPDAVGAEKYLRQTSNTGVVDDDGQNIGGFFPGGWIDGQNVHFMAAGQSQLNGFKPLIPVPMYQWFLDSAPDRVRLLGYAPDIRHISLLGLNVAQEITVASDTWTVFPITRKGNFGLSFNQEQSYDYGIAYKKVTT